MDLNDFIHRLPKVELHVHLEGSVTAARLHEFARRYRTNLAGLNEDRIQNEFFVYSDFPSFLEAYKIVCQHLREPEDYATLLRDLAENLKSQNVRYAEIFFTPAIPWKFGKDGREVLVRLLEVSAEFRRNYGIRIGWILDNVRQFGPGLARDTARLALEFRDSGVLGIGLGGDENSLPAADFEEVFAWSRANSLFSHVHAGETGGPDQVWDALKTLGANRIGHGIQAARDPKLMEYLRDRTIGLDICLSSNAQTGAWRPISSNPFWLLHKRGVPVTLSTDDPGMFNTSLIKEYRKAVNAFGLEHGDLIHIALQGVRSSFLGYEEKTRLMQEFQDEIARLTP